MIDRDGTNAEIITSVVHPELYDTDIGRLDSDHVQLGCPPQDRRHHRQDRRYRHS